MRAVELVGIAFDPALPQRPPGILVVARALEPFFGGRRVFLAFPMTVFTAGWVDDAGDVAGGGQHERDRAPARLVARHSSDRPVRWPPPLTGHANDVAHDPHSVGAPTGHPPVRTFLGVPLLEHAPKSRVHQSLVGMANALCGKVPADAPKKERRSFFSFR